MIATCIASVLLMGGQVHAKTPIKFVIRHADPYLVKALLEGRSPITPELSIRLARGGPAMLGAAQLTALFQGGYWFVNPTDNSLWFVPDN